MNYISSRIYDFEYNQKDINTLLEHSENSNQSFDKNYLNIPSVNNYLYEKPFLYLNKKRLKKIKSIYNEQLNSDTLTKAIKELFPFWTKKEHEEETEASKETIELEIKKNDINLQCSLFFTK